MVRAYPTRATVRIPGPSYFTMRRKDSSKIHMASEILTVIPAERREFEGVGGKAFEEEMQKPRWVRKKTIS